MRRLHLRTRWLAAALLLACGCGYGAVSGGERAPLGVAPGEIRVPEPLALSEAMFGARTALARSGVLRPEGTFPRIVVSVLALEERSLGIAAPLRTTASPLARGSSFTLTGRAVIEAQAGEITADSGEMSVTSDVGSGPDARADTLSHDDAIRALGRRLGEALVRRLLGEAALGRMW